MVKHHKNNPFTFKNEEGEKEDVIMPVIEEIPEENTEEIAAA